jgi:organic hydroperoxide reductase OsmC/OhrA
MTNDKEHNYSVNIQWTGNKGTGTSGYAAYDRSHFIQAKEKQPILSSSDPAFRGDPTKYNPEELLVASVSSCHMLWYLHLCADAGIVVTDYIDEATGTMVEDENGGGRFAEIILHPHVTITDLAMIDKANQLHEKAHQHCFIANSCNFPIKHKAVFKVIQPV